MINYTNVMLLALGVAGVLLHNLLEMAKLNKKPEYNFTIGKYLLAERFSIIASVIIVCVALAVKHEIKQLDSVSQWLGLAFLAIGYMGQSILIKFIGKAEKVIE